MGVLPQASHRKEIRKLTYVSFRISLRWLIHIINSVDKTKLSKEKQFTWRDKAFQIKCRLDYFLVSQNLVNLAKDCHIIHAPGSDHCAVKLFIQSDSLNKKAGPGFRKFNSSLLEDESYITELKENIKIHRNK